MLKRARVEVEDVLKFDCTVIRTVLEYCAQAFHHSLPKYLAEELEVVQKRVMKITSPEMAYCDASSNIEADRAGFLRSSAWRRSGGASLKIQGGAHYICR